MIAATSVLIVCYHSAFVHRYHLLEMKLYRIFTRDSRNCYSAS